jgi:hypothetical protein
VPWVISATKAFSINFANLERQISQILNLNKKTFPETFFERDCEQMSAHKKTGTFKTIDDQISNFSCTWEELNSSQKMKRSLQCLGAFWAGSVLSVLIPILHFVLVPGFFIAGIVLSVRLYRQDILLKDVEGVCPNCQKPLIFKKLVYGPEMKERCANCHTTFQISVSGN